MVMSTSKYLDAAQRTRTLEHQEDSKRKRILVVEDNQMGLMLLGQLLKAQGYDILQTSEGWRAIDLARDNHPDLILIDIGLPDNCGLDVTRLLKQDDQTKTIAIIAVTAFAMPGDEERSLESGCDAYIAKPILMDKLLRAVESFLSSPSGVFSNQ
jgi:two-component system, cell cycle response regulator DivK